MSYCLYGILPENVKRMIANTIQEFNIEFRDSLIYEIAEDPHVTIVYGPKKNPVEAEITTYDRNAIDKVYPRLISNFMGVLPELNYRGVAHFDRPTEGRFIVGLEFNSAQLTAILRHVYNSRQDLREYRSTCKEAILNVAFDRSWDEEPERWAHVSIGIVKRDSDILLMQQFIRDKLTLFPNTVTIKEIQLISAIQDIPITLW